MLDWFPVLPLPAQIAIIVGIVVLLIVLAFLGKVHIKIGKWNIVFGKPSQPVKKRSCSDCRKLVMTRTIKFDQDHKMLKDDILRDQMNYAEQKIHEVFYMLTSSYRDDIVKCREEGAPVDQARESKEYLLYQETLNGALLLAKNEIRRAFKENGFEELSPQEFSDYVKGKAKLLISMAREYTRARYPFETMIVPMEWRFNRLPEAIIESIAVDLFCKAKQIKQTTDEKIENLCSEYDRDMEELEKA